MVTAVVTQLGSEQTAVLPYVVNGTGNAIQISNKSLSDLLVSWLNNSGNSLPSTTSLYDSETLQLQTAATLSQATPAQNTYYDILAATVNVNPLVISCAVATTGETLQVRAVIDGRTFTASVSASAGTLYYCTLINNAGVLGISLGSTAAVFNSNFPSINGFRSVRISVEKTTNSGSGTITGTVEYQKR
jgi:hypothetical protein